MKLPKTFAWALVWVFSSLAGAAQLSNEVDNDVVKIFKHPGGVRGIAFSRSGKLLATAGRDGTVRLWEVDGRSSDLPLTQGSEVGLVVLSDDGSRLLTVSDVESQLWDLSTTPAECLGHLAVKGWRKTTKRGSLSSRVRLAAGPIRAAAFSTDGKRLVTGGDDHAAQEQTLFRPVILDANGG